jgi:hypothetical protein
MNDNDLDTEHKYNGIYNNYINGNISDFRNQVKALTPLELLDLIEAMRGYYGIAIHNTIATLRMALNTESEYQNYINGKSPDPRD